MERRSFGYTIGHPSGDLSKDERDIAPYCPKAPSFDPAFSWGDHAPPRTPWDKTVIYEMHVKGFTRLFTRIPKETRGTYEGLCSAKAIGYLVSLGVTAVELMPGHQFMHDRHLVERGLSNYWGYNTISFFPPLGIYIPR